MNQRIRKLITIRKALHPRDGVDRRYVSRKEGGRGLASIEDIVDTSIQRLEDYTEKHVGELITPIRNDTKNRNTNRMTITRKNEKKKNSMGILNDYKQHLRRENIDVPKKRKPYERNGISPNSNTKQCHKNQSYKSERRNKIANVGYVVIETKTSIT